MSLLATLAKPFAPPIHTIRHYSATKFRRDLLAGLTVSVVEVPQAMAYALIAGVPPIYGLYTSVLQGVIGAMLSSSEHMTTGPTNTQSLLIAAAIKGIVAPDADPGLYLHLVFMLTFMKGILQLTFAAARLGDLVRYVSRSVIVGLVGGAGVLIIVGQLPSLLGFDIDGVRSGLPPFFDHIDVLNRLVRTWRSLPHTNAHALGIGLGVIAIVYGLRAISRLLPGALTAVIAAAAVVMAMGWKGPVPVIAELPAGLPHLVNPWGGFAYARELLAGALALAVLGMLESVAIAKSIAAKTGEKIIPNQEFFAQGLKNTVTSFFSCIPGSGSFTRSALDYEAGAETRFAAVFNAIFVALIVIVLRKWTGYIPLASLAGVLIVIAIGLIEVRYFLRLARTSRSDTLVAASTFAATLVAPLQYAIFIGVFINIATYLRRAGRLHVAEMVPTVAGPFLEHPLTDRSGHKRVMFLQVEGDLFFGMADELEDRLIGLIRSGVRIVILRLKRANSVDATVLHALEQFATELQRRGGHLILCGIRPELMKVLQGYGLTKTIGEGNVFEASFGVFASAKAAIKRAKQLAGTSIDTTALDAHLDSEVVDYAI